MTEDRLSSSEIFCVRYSGAILFSYESPSSEAKYRYYKKTKDVNYG